MRELFNRVTEQWAFIPSSQQQNDKLAIFIHGYMGNYLTTWGELPEMLLTEADKHEAFKDWDYLFIGYNTNDLQSYLEIASLIASFWKSANKGITPFKRPYSKLALFGHSLGTLGIRQLLCCWSHQPQDFLTQLKSVTLFGTPINGSRLAGIGKLIFRTSISDSLKQNNPQLRMLKVWSDNVYPKQPWPEIAVILGLNDKVVGGDQSELINWKGDSQVIHTTLDHRSLVKPKSWNESIIIGHIQSALS